MGHPVIAYTGDYHSYEMHFIVVYGYDNHGFFLYDTNNFNETYVKFDGAFSFGTARAIFRK